MPERRLVSIALRSTSQRHRVSKTAIWFVKELMKKAFAAGDTNAKNLMLPQALAKLPARLSKAIGDGCVDIQFWDELSAKVEAVSRAKIDQVVAEEKKQKLLEERLLKIEGKAPESAPASSPADTPEHEPSNTYPYQRPFMANRYPVPSPARTAPHVPVARVTAPPAALDPLAVVMPLTSKAMKLMHENTVQDWKEFRQEERDWDDRWGANMFPTAARPYPLQPGGTELGAASWWTCGHDGHFGRDFTAPDADRLSAKESFWRQSNQSQSQGHPPAAPRTPITLRSRAYPNTLMAGLSFVTPPRAPNTPSPAFRRQPPPHMSQPNFLAPANNVLMVVDTQGNHYGDIDPSQMYGEWEEMHPDIYYSGNGSGSNGM
ncbi:hypothetical protein B0H13DRAFT_1928317 [Mycena leptocephala]|nr:hypothetical protein B0H13DRAFT_1928317 [Mycena leptocephala]